MKTYTLDQLLDKHIGTPDTPEREQFEADVAASVQAYKLGEAIKKARIEQNLTKEQLGERIGVKKAQISRIERGGNISFNTMSRVFRALGLNSAFLDLGSGLGRVALL